MTEGRISRRVIADRRDMLSRLLQQVRALPLEDRGAFFGDQTELRFEDIYRGVATVEMTTDEIMDLTRGSG